PPSCWIVLAKPDIGVSTKNIFKRYIHEERSRSVKKDIIQALYEIDFMTLASSIENVLEPVTFSLYPEVKRMKEKMSKYGAVGSLMSGSGPTIYGLVKQHS